MATKRKQAEHTGTHGHDFEDALLVPLDDHEVLLGLGGDEERTAAQRAPMVSSPLSSFTEEQNEHLTKSLRAVRDNANAPEALKELAQKMLSGRLQLKDVLDDPAGNRALGAGLASLKDQWRSMSPQERQAVRERDPDEDAPREGLGTRRTSRY
ncbi:hypothetical protein [Streptomyces sioyaensis]|uniref:hypothetical protein n=1 Tax=Streptomyces sioyaensis TaxID=67364 RepID=UPI00378D1182